MPIRLLVYFVKCFLILPLVTFFILFIVNFLITFVAKIHGKVKQREKVKFQTILLPDDFEVCYSKKDITPGTLADIYVDQEGGCKHVDGLVLAPTFRKTGCDKIRDRLCGCFIRDPKDEGGQCGIYCYSPQEDRFRYQIFFNGKEIGGAIIFCDNDVVTCLGYKGNKSFENCIYIVDSLQRVVTEHLEVLGLKRAQNDQSLEKAFSRLFCEIYNPNLVSWNEYLIYTENPEWAIDQKLLATNLKNFPKLPEYKIETQILDEVNNISSIGMHKLIAELGLGDYNRKAEYIDDRFRLLLKPDGSPFASFLIITIQGPEKDNFSTVIVGECFCECVKLSENKDIVYEVYKDGVLAEKITDRFCEGGAIVKSVNNLKDLQGSDLFPKGQILQSRVAINVFGINIDGALDKILFDKDLGIIRKFLLNSITTDVDGDLFGAIQALLVQRLITDYTNDL